VRQDLRDEHGPAGAQRGPVPDAVERGPKQVRSVTRALEPAVDGPAHDVEAGRHRRQVLRVGRVRAAGAGQAIGDGAALGVEPLVVEDVARRELGGVLPRGPREPLVPEGGLRSMRDPRLVRREVQRGGEAGVRFGDVVDAGEQPAARRRSTARGGGATLAPWASVTGCCTSSARCRRARGELRAGGAVGGLAAGGPAGGRVLFGLRDADGDVPWQRVVNARGGISTFKVGAGELQVALLRAEGIEVATWASTWPAGAGRRRRRLAVGGAAARLTLNRRRTIVPEVHHDHALLEAPPEEAGAHRRAHVEAAVLAQVARVVAEARGRGSRAAPARWR
jgi:alkylated DNA nucleotide flippase Atl1